MTMLETFIKPMHREGYKFVAIFAAITLVLFLIWDPLGWIGVGLTVWCYYFFRDAKRAIPQGRGLIVSPADGIVSLIERAVPPPELGVGHAELTRVSVFMSVFNCHVNRTPIASRLVKMAYRPGKFFNAAMDKASTDNERNSLLLELPDGRLDVHAGHLPQRLARRREGVHRSSRAEVWITTRARAAQLDARARARTPHGPPVPPRGASRSAY